LDLHLVSAVGAGNFKIIRDRQDICLLHYSNWFSSEAEARIHGNHIKITPRNFGFQSYNIYKDDRHCGVIIYSWFKHIKINLARLDGGEDRFFLRPRGFLKPWYQLIGSKGVVILQLRGSKKPIQLDYRYEIELHSDGYADGAINELLIYCGFAVNLHKFAIACF